MVADLGISLQDHVPLPLHGLPLWRGNLAVALPPQSPLASHKPIALDELMDVSLLRWQGEPCAALMSEFPWPEGGSPSRSSPHSR